MSDTKDAPACALRLQPDTAQEADAITKLLRDSHTVAVVGLSSRAHRPSYSVAEYLRSVGYRIVPVNPAETEVVGERAYAKLEDVPEKIDIVDIFRRSEFVTDIVEAAIRVGAKAVWMQEGVVNEPAAERARKAGLVVVMDRCMHKEHAKRRTLQVLNSMERVERQRAPARLRHSDCVSVRRDLERVEIQTVEERIELAAVQPNPK